MNENWIYFQVDVDMGIRLVPDAKIEDYIGYYDGRLFRTNGVVVQASYINSDDSTEWKEAVVDEVL
jgi:hypothetical protein